MYYFPNSSTRKLPIPVFVKKKKVVANSYVEVGVLLRGNCSRNGIIWNADKDVNFTTPFQVCEHRNFFLTLLLAIRITQIL
jgi:hypothetical protein